MPRHRLAPQAEEDLGEIWLHVARERSPDAADRLVDNLAARFLRLAHHPYIGRDRSADLQPGLRSLPAEAYVILYSVHHSAAHILSACQIPHIALFLPFSCRHHGKPLQTPATARAQNDVENDCAAVRPGNRRPHPAHSG